MGEWPWIVVHSSGDQDYPVSVLSIFKIHNLLTLIPIKEPCYTTWMITFQVTDGSSQGGCGGTLIADNWVGNLFVSVKKKNCKDTTRWTLQLFLSLYRKSLLRYNWGGHCILVINEHLIRYNYEWELVSLLKSGGYRGSLLLWHIGQPGKQKTPW